MADQTAMIEVMEARARRREDRRDLFRMLGGKALAGGAATVAAATAVQAQAAPTEADVLNFALNLEYLEGQFYAAAVGLTLANADLTGTGTRGEATGGRAVPFGDNVVRQYAREIAQDEIAHVRFLRAQLGAAAVAQPAIDIGTAPDGAFSSAARAAGLIGAGQSFDVYANDDNFLLGAYIFEDVGVTAYKGAARFLTTAATVQAAAAILAVEAYHAGLIRTILYGRGVDVPALRSAADAISNARDSLDGGDDRDQGISPLAPASNNPSTAQATTVSNIVPLDANGLAFSRSGAQVLNIVYLNNQAVRVGGFFPNGVNGTINQSGAN